MKLLVTTNSYLLKFVKEISMDDPVCDSEDEDEEYEEIEIIN